MKLQKWDPNFASTLPADPEEKDTLYILRKSLESYDKIFNSTLSVPCCSGKSSQTLKTTKSSFAKESIVNKGNKENEYKLCNIQNKSSLSTISNPLNSKLTTSEEDIEESKLNISKQAPASFYEECILRIVQLLGPFSYDDMKYPTEGCEYQPPKEIESQSIYIGQWKNGKKQGKGKQICVDGSLYEGYWLNNQPHGKGRMIYANCDVYEGEWVNGKCQGKGL